jgi:hypothetical protein
MSSRTGLIRTYVTDVHKLYFIDCCVFMTGRHCHLLTYPEEVDQRTYFFVPPMTPNLMPAILRNLLDLVGPIWQTLRIPVAMNPQRPLTVQVVMSVGLGRVVDQARAHHRDLLLELHASEPTVLVAQRKRKATKPEDE